MGAHPQIDDWYFREQLIQDGSDDHKSLWRVVPSKSYTNHLAIGQGKNPELRQYIKISAGAYRLSFGCRPNNSLHFAFFEMENFDPAALGDIDLLRAQKFCTPEFVSFDCHRAPGVTNFSRIIIFPKDGWYALLISSPNTKAGTWSRLWGLKLEKLN